MLSRNSSSWPAAAAVVCWKKKHISLAVVQTKTPPCASRDGGSMLLAQRLTHAAARPRTPSSSRPRMTAHAMQAACGRRACTRVRAYVAATCAAALGRKLLVPCMLPARGPARRMHARNARPLPWPGRQIERGRPAQQAWLCSSAGAPHRPGQRGPELHAAHACAGPLPQPRSTASAGCACN